ncbi:hypothetical protein MtrunA17_Chr3g0143451 [Medicago truncatula]|uniref:Uncharacterized protein n=1 Tax=Medicago truncatula TaxID=3880 RepID=A0A396J2U4_MEDTR|nr:hypothetical protein MtrunA17_Chr3g0143451 [Medicago truncatula]
MSGRIMEKLNMYGLSHLFMTVFLHNLSTFMVQPAITDVTMAALCPGQDECSIAIYLTGFQQAVRYIVSPIYLNILHSFSKLTAYNNACSCQLSINYGAHKTYCVISCICFKHLIKLAYSLYYFGESKFVY